MIFFWDMDRRWLKRHLPKIGLLILCVVISGLLVTKGNLLAGYGSRDFTLTERLLTQFRVVVFYLSLMVLPHPSRLTINHDISISHGLLDPVTTLLSMLLVAALMLVAVLGARRERLLSFCILWYFGHLAIESSILPLELVFEHRTYLPSVGPILLGVAMYYRFTGKLKYQFVPLAIMVLVWSYWAHERSHVWSDKVSFWSDTAQKSPDVARVYNNLGVAYEERRELDQAMAQYRKAFSLDPVLYRALNNIGSIHLENRDYEDALHAFNQSREIDPNDVDAYKGLALTYYAMGDRKTYLEYLAKVNAMEAKGRD